MKRETKVNAVRASAAGLVLVAAATLAVPGWGQEQEQKPVQKQEQKQESKQKQERGTDELGPAARVIRTIGRDLRLSREQRRSLLEIVQRRHDELRGAAHDVGEARRVLREKVLADTADEAAIRSAAERLGAAIGTAAVLTARVAGEARPLLTPAQRERLQKMRDRWETRRERGRDRIEIWEGD